MIKNIIFDVGGIILDDSVENLSRVFGKDMNTIYKKVYSGNFKKCLLGELSMSEYAKEFVNDSDYDDICRILNSDNQKLVTPLILEKL